MKLPGITSFVAKADQLAFYYGYTKTMEVHRTRVLRDVEVVFVPANELRDALREQWESGHKMAYTVVKEEARRLRFWSKAGILEKLSTRIGAMKWPGSPAVEKKKLDKRKRRAQRLADKGG
jgi:hypothetical protein